ncbi:hypothetical protein K3495_g10364 [Podosphaera aphanis]|nr:hypothetical protein K3495_g10364 [Podosphaera aphanis]
MAQNLPSAPSEYIDTGTEDNHVREIHLTPPEYWNVPYLLHGPGIFEAASRTNPVRLSEVMATVSLPQSSTFSSQLTQPMFSAFKVSAPPITPYDGTQEKLRPFISQLLNQSQGQLFPDELAKVRFAYQCLGPGALAKMRSSFRYLEDPSKPQKIKTLSDFITALKQCCQDPGLLDKASTIVETLYQGNSAFHDFITLFEDSLVDSIYANHDKSHWKAMLERRISNDLKRALLTAYNVPQEYHSFVAYLRTLDAGLQIIRSSRQIKTPSVGPHISAMRPNPPVARPSLAPSSENLTVSQGGSAMDLDIISRQRQPNGKLTQQAKDARRALNRCVWCNTEGHIAIHCPLESQKIASATVKEYASQELKE